MGDVVVSIDNLRKVYVPSPLWMSILLRSAISKPVIALDGVSFDVRAGEICAVVGPNGAGKSTMFRILTGLITPTAGQAVVMGHDATTQSAQVRKLVGFMPSEDRTLWLRHTCWENLVFHGRLRGLSSKQLRARVSQVLELVGLTNAVDRAGFALSSGMRARLQLARALLHQPKVLILDEPTGALDPVGAYEFLEIIKQLAAEEDQAVLISSHRLEEIEALEHNIVLLDRGKVVYAGDLESMRSIWDQPRVEITFADAESAQGAASLVAGLADVEVLAVDGLSVTFSTSANMGRLLSMLNGRLSQVTSVKESRVPLRELLTAILPSVSGTETEGS